MSSGDYLNNTGFVGVFQDGSAPIGNNAPSQYSENTPGGGRKAGGVWYTIETADVDTSVFGMWRRIGESIANASNESYESAGMIDSVDSWLNSSQDRIINKKAEIYVPTAWLMEKPRWAVSGRLGVMIIGDFGLTSDGLGVLSIAANDVVLLRWINDNGLDMIVVEPNGRTCKHLTLPGGEYLAKALLEFYLDCKRHGIESGLHANEVVLFDLDETNGETRFTWSYCVVGYTAGRATIENINPAIWPWEECTRCASA